MKKTAGSQKSALLITALVFGMNATFTISAAWAESEPLSASGSSANALREAKNTPTLTPREAAYLDPETYVLLDVRSGSEWWLGHIAGAKHLALGDIAEKSQAELERLFPNKDLPIVTYCEVGGRASRAAALLETKGFGVIAVTNGGYKQLKAEGLRVEF